MWLFRRQGGEAKIATEAARLWSLGQPDFDPFFSDFDLFFSDSNPFSQILTPFLRFWPLFFCWDFTPSLDHSSFCFLFSVLSFQFQFPIPRLYWLSPLSFSWASMLQGWNSVFITWHAIFKKNIPHFNFRSKKITPESVGARNLRYLLSYDKSA